MGRDVICNISIHAPRRGSDRGRCVECGCMVGISIHAPRRGSDDYFTSALPWPQFQSTLPAGEATDQYSSSGFSAPISIHAPRRGSDLPTLVSRRFLIKFQSTLPAGEATAHLGEQAILNKISIHAPRRGSDSTVKAYSNDRIKRSTLREPHFLFSKNACFSPIFSMCATTSHTKNQRIRVSFGSYPGLAPTCFTLAWYRFPRL